MPLLSVIIPVYNAERYLKKCIESVAAQTFEDLEIILVDDGSPDNSPQICDEAAKTDKRILVIHQINRGVSAARNTGLSHAKGKYIAFVDCDDTISKDMYKEMITCAEDQDCEIVMCDTIKELKDHTETVTQNIRQGRYSRKQLEEEYFKNLLITEDLQYPPTISNVTFIFKKDICNEYNIRYLEGVRFSEDLIFGAELMYHANSFYYLKGKTYYHYNCMNELSATHTFKEDKWSDYIKIYDHAVKVFKEKDFSLQMNKMLLFFVYNATGDILKNDSLDKDEKRKLLNNILNSSFVKDMWKELPIKDLQISLKQKMITHCMKTTLGKELLIIYYGRKNKAK